MKPIAATFALAALALASQTTVDLGRQNLVSIDTREMRPPGIRATVKRIAPGVLHIQWRLKQATLTEAAVRLRFLPGQSRLWEAARRDFHWIPNIKAKPGHIAADHVFRSPVVLLLSGAAGAALIPDLDVLRGHRPAPHFLDLQFPSGEAPFIEYGLARSRPDGHVYYTRTGEAFAPEGGEVRFACYLLLREKTTRGQLTAEATEFIWKRFAARYTASVKPQVTPFSTYARYGYEMALKHLWVEGPLPGTGGITLTTLLNKQTGEYRGRAFFNDLWFHSWFNNLRTAWGLHYWGGQLHRPEWVQRAREMARLILSAPREAGLFATIYKPHDGSWQSSGQGAGAGLYHLPDNAWTAIWLLRFHQEREPVEEAPAFLNAFAETLLRFQHEDGSFPARVKTGKLAADPVLDKSASSALPLWFLAEMLQRGMLPPGMRDAARQAVRKGAEFLRTRVLPQQRFEDFELYFSCSRKPLDFYDEITAMSGQNTLAMQWSAEALRLAYLLSRDARDLAAAQHCLDLLSLYQQAWSPPYMDFYAFGGFGVMNTDGEWNDARQAQFAETYANFYELTGKAEYMQRAMAAARAGFALVVMEENKQIAPRNYEGTPLNFEVHGASAENYGHGGRNARSYQSGFHWGTGSALTTAAVLKHRYSSLLLHPGRRHAFGIDGAAVKQARWSSRAVDLDLEILPGETSISGKLQPPKQGMRIRAGNRRGTARNDGSFTLEVRPKGEL